MSRPFVTARMQGRLGNNLFQVAATSALAWDHDAEPCFPDIQPSWARYQHVLFRCNIESPETDVAFEWREPSFAYTPIPFRPNMRIIGYFQSEKYFAHHRQRLCELFRPSPADAAYLDDTYRVLLGHPDSVGVQLRYYRDEDPAGALFPQYGRHYLEQAAALFPDSALFVVSSNHAHFARASVPSRMKHVMFLKGEPDYMEFFLLSRCRHNIITNSSFGWWAAWLNQHRGKRVVRPRRWIGGLPEQDVCPEEWISL